VNIANGDMVGHTGDLKATIVACETVDKAVKVHAFSLGPFNPVFYFNLPHALCTVTLCSFDLLYHDTFFRTSKIVKYFESGILLVGVTVDHSLIQRYSSSLA